MLSSNFESHRRILVRGCLWLCLVLCYSLVGWAQTVNGSFRGTVSDASGANIPGAAVKILEVSTGVTRQVTTDSNGSYVIPDVPPGVYDFTVSFTGFATTEDRGVSLAVNQIGTLDFSLQPGSMTQEVTVAAQAPLVNVTNATIGTVIGSQEVAQLPLNGRQFTQLILLSPGAAPQESKQQGVWDLNSSYGATSPPVNGARAENNNYTIDGVGDNEFFFDFAAVSPPPDAIQEFNVQTDMSSGQYGQAAGANVNIVTKSGGNQFHGDAWEFLRNNALDSRNFFSPSVSVHHQNQFGATAGGPIRKDKIWAFGWYEGFRSTLGSSILSQVPTATQLAGNLTGFLPIFNPFSTTQTGTNAPVFSRTAFTNNQIPTGLLNPTAEALAKLMYPTPNYSGANGINYLNAQPAVTNANQFGIRVDAALTQKTSLFGRFAWSNGNETMPSSIPSSPGYVKQEPVQQVLGLTHIFSPTLVLDLHAQYLRTYVARTGVIVPTSFLQSNGILNDWPANPGLPALLPTMTISDVTSITGSKEGLAGSPINNWEYNGSVTKTTGKHTVTAGASVVHTWVLDNCTYATATFNQVGTDDPNNPSTTGSGLASFLLGVPTSAQRLAGTAEMTYTTNYVGLYADDVWKATPNLTVTLGVRYDYESPPVETQGRAGTLDLARSTPTSTAWFLQKQANPPLVNLANSPVTIERVNSVFLPNQNDWGPRVGLAYRLPHNTVVRSGYGIFYDFNANTIDSQEVMGEWPFGFPDFTPSDLNEPIAGQPTPTNVLGTNVFPPFAPTVVPPPGEGWVMNRANKTPSIQLWNFGLSKSFGSNWAVSATYVGSKGTHILMYSAINIAASPGPGSIAARAPLPQFSPLDQDANVSNSSFQALEVKVERRFSQGLSVLASYTHSKSIDVQSAHFGDSQPGEGVPNSIYIKGNRGVSDYDLPENLVLNWVYDLPVGAGKRFSGGPGWAAKHLLSGWQTTGILSLHTGFPFSIAAPYDVANTGASGERPWLVAPLLPSGFQQTLGQWFNTSAVNVIPYTYGNMGRNLIRQDGVQNLDFGIFKGFNITESKRFEFRTESFNLFNHAAFGAPNVTMTSKSFGTVSSAGNPRFIQFGLKFVY